MANRQTLKGYFKTGEIPTEEHFAELIHSNLNSEEDGIRKFVNSPLQIQADGSTSMSVIDFFESFKLKKEVGISLSKIEDRGGEWKESGISINDAENTSLTLRVGAINNPNIEGRSILHNLRFSPSDDMILKLGINKNDAKAVASLESGIFHLLSGSTPKDSSSKFLIFDNKLQNLNQSIMMVSNFHPTNKDIEDSRLIISSGNSTKSSIIDISSGKIDINGYDQINMRSGGQVMLQISRNQVFSRGTIATNLTADFAEFFESVNKESIPVGVSVVLSETGKISPAKENDIPIGVISGHPAILGNSADEWPLKYLRDEIGNYIMEEVEEEVYENGMKNPVHPLFNTIETNVKKIKIMKPKINPSFDPTKEYIPRDQRPEWHPVGLLGQLHLRKGQPVAPTWVKIKDVSENVELWLVK